MHLTTAKKVGNHHVPLLKFKRTRAGVKPVSVLNLIDLSKNNVLSTEFQVHAVSAAGLLDGKFQSSDLHLTDQVLLNAAKPLPFRHLTRFFQQGYAKKIDPYLEGGSGELQAVWRVRGGIYFLSIFHNVEDVAGVTINYRLPDGSVVSEFLTSVPVFDHIRSTEDWLTISGSEYRAERTKVRGSTSHYAVSVNPEYLGMPIIGLMNRTSDPIVVQVTPTTISTPFLVDPVFHDGVYLRQLVDGLKRIPGLEVTNLLDQDIETKIISTGSFTIYPSKPGDRYDVVESNALFLRSRHIYARNASESKIRELGIAGESFGSWHPSISSGFISSSYTLSGGQIEAIAELLGSTPLAQASLNYDTDPEKQYGSVVQHRLAISEPSRVKATKAGDFVLKLPRALLEKPWQKEQDLEVYADGYRLPAGSVLSFDGRIVELGIPTRGFLTVEVAGRFIPDRTVYRGFIPPRTGVWQDLDLSPVRRKIDNIGSEYGYLVFLYPEVEVSFSDGSSSKFNTASPIRHLLIKDSEIAYYRDLLADPTAIPAVSHDSFNDIFPALPCIVVAFYQTRELSLIEDLVTKDITRGGGGLPTTDRVESRKQFGEVVENLTDLSDWSGIHIPVNGAVVVRGDQSILGRAVQGVEKFTPPGSIVMGMKK